MTKIDKYKLKLYDLFKYDPFNWKLNILSILINLDT